MPREARFGAEAPDATQDSAALAPDPVPAPTTEKAPVFRVADGRSITTKTGTFTGGEIITARDLDGEKHLSELVEAGAVTKS